MNNRFRYGILVLFPAQWLSIASAIVGICTLGYYVPSWDVNFMFWACMKYTRKYKGR